jgi:hypothetical protein
MDDIINNNNNKHRHRRKKKIKKHGGFTCTTEKDCIIAGINFYNENMFLDKDKDINFIYFVYTIFNSGSNFFPGDTKISNQCFWISVLTFLKIKNKTEINSVS